MAGFHLCGIIERKRPFTLTKVRAVVPSFSATSTTW